MVRSLRAYFMAGPSPNPYFVQFPVTVGLSKCVKCVKCDLICFSIHMSFLAIESLRQELFLNPVYLQDWKALPDRQQFPKEKFNVT